MLVALYSGGYCGEYSRNREIKWSSDFGAQFQIRREWLYICVGDKRLLSLNFEPAKTQPRGMLQSPII